MSNLNFLHSGGNKVTLSSPDSNPSSDVTFKLPQADGSTGDFLKTDGSGALSFGTPSSYKNYIINGAMQIAQRGTSSTSNGFGSLDRWYNNLSGGSATFSQETNSNPSETGGIQKYARLNVSSSSDYTGIRQRIEDVTSVPAGTVTLSFYAKGTAPAGGLYVYTTQDFGTGGSSDVDGTPVLITSSLTSSWVRYTAQISVGSVDGKTINAGSFFQVTISQGSNSSSTAYDLNITGVQVEAGDTATSFEHRSFGDELQRCKRYFQKICDGGDHANEVFGTAHAWNSVQAEVPLRWDVEMRAAPALEQGVGTNYYHVLINGVNKYTNQWIAYNFTTRAGLLYNTNFSGLSGGTAYRAKINNASAYLHLNAEL